MKFMVKPYLCTPVCSAVLLLTSAIKTGGVIMENRDHIEIEILMMIVSISA